MATVQSQILKVLVRLGAVDDAGVTIQGDAAASTVSGAANNGSGLIRITTSSAHGFVTGQKVHGKNVGGTTEANNTPSNPYWSVTVISPTVFDLVGSTFSNAWTSGGTFVRNLVGSVDAQQFTKEELLNIYNEARLTVIGLSEKFIPEVSKRIERICENVVPDASVTFAGGKASTPAGMIFPVSLRTAANLIIPIVPVSSFDRLRRLSSSTNPVVFRGRESGTDKFIGISTDIADASTYKLTYYGITDWALSDVTAGTAVESFNPTILPLLIDVAVMIANEQGALAIEGVFKQFINT